MLKKLISRKSPYYIATRSLIKGGSPVPPRDVMMSMCQPKPKYGPPPVHRAEFLNGIKVAAYNPMGGTIGACTVMFHAGSRVECNDSLGVTHFIRAGSGCSGLAHSGYMKARYLQQVGGYLTCNSDRQTVSFTLRCAEPVFADIKCFLTDCAIRCQFPDHELEDVRKIVRNDLQQRPREQHVLDLVQKACFAGPLSNSVYCEEDRINFINSDIIKKFIENNFKTNVCTVGSANIHYSETMKVATQIDCSRSDACAMASWPRGGYEFYDTGPGDDTYMAFAVPGAGTSDYRNCTKFAILAAACGIGNVHSGSHEWDRTPMEPVGILFDHGDVYTDFKAFNISYADTGCFGILVKTKAEMARCSAFKAVEFLGNIKCISCSQIETAKRRLKVGIAFNDDNCVLASENMALQAASGMAYDNAVQLGCFIDQITPDEVLAAASCVTSRCSGQMAYAVVGDVEAAPHDGELRC